MKTIADLVEFRRDLFFDGAVQINWFENDTSKRDKAATNFVFHGPKYHGVSAADIEENRGYRLTDTVSFVKNITEELGSQKGKENPITLAIAGYGTGKSHLGLTLSTLFSEPTGPVADGILSNIKNADAVIGSDLEMRLGAYEAPILVIPINGMGNFDLAAELSRQVIIRLNAYGLDTTPIDELWPRFQQAYLFVERNYELRQADFDRFFGSDCKKEAILHKLTTHEDLAFQWVNEVFEQANGYPIRAVGQESPQQLLQTLCDSYCGPGQPFQSILILFDEFGRYLEFAAEHPHIAGDAALQQIFEGVQDNADKCTLLCLNQYELKVYLSRITRDRQSTIQRYITRYDSAKKYYLSSNIETLFAHLIKKRDSKFISAYLADSRVQNLVDIQRWFPFAEQQSVWQDSTLYEQVVVQGCWPLHPLATLFLSRSSGFLQQRSAVTFVAEAFDRAEGRSLRLDEKPWSISATELCDSLLVKELVISEEYGQGGALAQSYETVTQKYEHDLSKTHRHALLAVLIAGKLGLKVTSKKEALTALVALIGCTPQQLESAVTELEDEYGVLEWNERFLRYEIIGDAVPRSSFIKFLKHKISGITPEQREELFASRGKAWAGLNDIEPQFAAENNITTSEWKYFASCTHLGLLPLTIKNCVDDCLKAIKPDDLRGQVVYCYVRGDEQLANARRQAEEVLEANIKRAKCGYLPILIIFLQDCENKISRILAEYSVLSGPISPDEEQKFSHFINDHKSKSLEELKQACDNLLKEREYIGVAGLTIEKTRLTRAGDSIFRQVYPEIVPFPFDGFTTTRGNAVAVKDCRLITAELLKGTLNHEWIATQEPRAQNRAKNLLRTWESLGEDGEIRLHPRHQGIRKVIISLEEKLEVEKILNVGTLLQDLMAPPLGFNIASAGLVLGIFLSPRKDVAVLALDEEDIALGTWIGKAFTGNFLDLKILKRTIVRYVSGSETGAWQKLLSQWDLAGSYTGKVSFMEKAQQLRDRMPLPPGELYERYLRLEEQTHKALKKLRLEIERDYTAARQAASQFFSEWLMQQSCLSSKQVGSFRHKMVEKIGKNFQKIGLRKKTQKIEEYTTKIIAHIEEREKVKFIVEDSRAFLQSHPVHAECRVAELRQLIRGAERLIEPLKEAGRQIEVPEVGRTLNKIDKYIKECRTQIKEHEKRVQELWDTSILSKEDVNNTQREVDLLLALFSGDKPENIEDLETMRKQLQEFGDNLSLWMDLGISNAELEASVAKRIDFEMANQDDENEPVWDPEETYNNILKSLQEERKQAATRWISQLAFSKNDIVTMDARECQVAMGRLETTPVYLSSDQNILVDDMQVAIRDRLNSLKLEGVLEMYNNLSESLQMQFIEIISAGRK